MAPHAEALCKRNDVVAPQAEALCKRNDVVAPQAETLCRGKTSWLLMQRRSARGTTSWLLEQRRSARGTTSWLLKQRRSARGTTSWLLKTETLCERNDVVAPPKQRRSARGSGARFSSASHRRTLRRCYVRRRADAEAASRRQSSLPRFSGPSSSRGASFRSVWVASRGRAGAVAQSPRGRSTQVPDGAVINPSSGSCEPPDAGVDAHGHDARAKTCPCILSMTPQPLPTHTPSPTVRAGSRATPSASKASPHRRDQPPRPLSYPCSPRRPTRRSRPWPAHRSRALPAACSWTSSESHVKMPPLPLSVFELSHEKQSAALLHSVCLWHELLSQSPTVPTAR